MYRIPCFRYLIRHRGCQTRGFHDLSLATWVALAVVPLNDVASLAMPAEPISDTSGSDAGARGEHHSTKHVFFLSGNDKT